MTTLTFKPNPNLPRTDAPIEDAPADYNTNQKTSRRKLLAILGTTAAGAGTIVALRSAYRSGALENLLNPEEKINTLSPKDDPNANYVEFRSSTFKFYRVQATAQDNGVLSLIYRANAEFGSRPIKGDIASRATDLFSMISINNIDIAQKGSFKAKYNGAVGINAGQFYNVPVYVK